MSRPLCFVLMPFGSKSDAQGRQINFDAVYETLIRPAVCEADLEAIRADEEVAGGIIHRAMFERLILCPYAVADLTLANANVFYELGVRHAIRPYTTITLFAEGTRLPFDVSIIRATPYRLSATGNPDDVDAPKLAVANRLRAARENATDDSPVFQLIDDLPWRNEADQLQHAKADAFRDRVRYSESVKVRLARARQLSLDEVRHVENDIRTAAGTIANADLGVLVDLFLSYRAVEAWDEMARLVDEMPWALKRGVMVREQLALALNRRAGETLRQGNVGESRVIRNRAVYILTELIRDRGPCSETNGILGRIYKDCWEESCNAGDEGSARAWLEKAIETYCAGFEADWRDAYPGVNALTLMEIHDPPVERRTQLAPVVAYAVERRIATKRPDYWDFATRLELAVLMRDRATAGSACGDALTCQPERWQIDTTRRNLRLIRQAWAARGEEVAWLVALEKRLEAAIA